ncbi:MAG: glycosyltransferase family 39 protein [Chloroflexi bacterium]|nr:glycosyltransferase family 39 protein [Chloroflexota bacterium]
MARDGTTLAQSRRAASPEPLPLTVPLPTILALAAVSAVVCLGAYLRFSGLATNPGWDPDEGYNFNITWNLLHGRWQMFALSYTFVQHPPLFYLLGAGAFALFGSDLYVLRGLAATCGVVSIGLIYLAGAELGGRRTGFFAAFLLAIYPAVVVHNRLAYTYNLGLTLGLATLLCAARYARTRRARWRYAAAIVAGLGLATDQVGIALVVFVTVVSWLVNRRATPVTFAVALAPSWAYILTMLATAPSDFLFDLGTTVNRVTHGGVAVQILQVLFHYRSFLEYDYWIPIGLIGLFLLESSRARALGVGFAAVMLAVTLQIREVNPFFRTAIPLFGPLALGLGVLVHRAIVAVFQWLAQIWDQSLPSWTWPVRSLVIMAGLGLVLGTPIGLAVALSVLGVQIGLPYKADWTLADPAAVREVAAYVNATVSRDELVIGSANVVWLIEAQVADLHQSVAAEGLPAAFYPSGIPARRFQYDPFVGSARYVITDPFLQRFRQAKEAQREDELLRTVETSWPVAFRSGAYVVYANPAPRSN